MSTNQEVKIKKIERTEEVQYIIERMPNKFGRIASIVVFFIFSLLLLFGWLVRYPDVVTGQISINARQAPLKLIASYSGKLQLHNIQSQDSVSEGQIIAWIENPAVLEDVSHLTDLINSISLPTTEAVRLFSYLPSALELGDLTPRYFSFLNALKQLADYQSNRWFDKQAGALQQLLLQQQDVLTATINKIAISEESLELVNRFNLRDSILYTRNVLSAADFDRTKLNSIGARDQYQSALRDLANCREQISRTESQLQELNIQKIEKQQQLNLDLLTAYNDLRDNLRSWEQKYVFKAPFNGQVQFLQFWNNNQFVQAGDPIFTIIPLQKQILGQVLLPATGAGKVKIGQEVIVKLEDYPYLEYGSISSFVRDISLTTNTVKSQYGDLQMYLVTVEFPDELKTNYGSQLEFRYEIKGSAEIITNDRRLIQRFYDNLKYITNR